MFSEPSVPFSEPGWSVSGLTLEFTSSVFTPVVQAHIYRVWFLGQLLCKMF